MLLNITLVGIYFVAVLVIGWLAGKKETPQDFLIASRDAGFFRTTASIFAVLGGEMLIAQSAFAYSIGFGAIWFWVGAAVGTTLLAFAIPKIKALGDSNNFLNISEYFGLKWGEHNKLFAGVIICITFFALLVLQFMAVGNIVSPLFSVSYPTIVLVSGLVVLIYLLLGGYKAVLNTDLLQAILMIVLLVAMVLFMDIGTINFSQSIFAAGTTMFVSVLLIGIFIIFASADIWQRIFSARSTRVARNSLFTVSLLFIVFGATLTLVGIAAHNHFPSIDPSEAFYWGLSALLPTWLLGAGVVMVLATVMSTIDTETYLLSSIIGKDFVARNRTDMPDQELARIIRILMLILLSIAVIIAIFVRDVVTVMFAFGSFGLTLVPAIASSFFWKLKPRAVFLSMCGGVLTFAALIVSGQFNPDNAVATLPGALLFLIIGQVIFRNTDAQITKSTSF